MKFEIIPATDDLDRIFQFGPLDTVMMVRDETILGKIVHCAECAGEFEAMGMFEALGVERGVVADSQVHLLAE